MKYLIFIMRALTIILMIPLVLASIAICSFLLILSIPIILVVAIIIIPISVSSIILKKLEDYNKKDVKEIIELISKENVND